MSSKNGEPLFSDYEATLILVVSVVCGTLGFLLLCAIIGFLADHCGCFDERRKKKPVSQFHNTSVDFNWSIYQKMSHHPSRMNENVNKNAARNFEEQRTTFSNGNYEAFYNDDDAFLSSAFVSAKREPNATENFNPIKTVSYSSDSKLLRPERKPAPTVLYPKNKIIEPMKQLQNQEIRISLADEAIIPDVNDERETVAVPVDNFDPHAWVRANQEKEDKDEVRVVIPKDLEVDLTPQVVEHQAIDYENPKIESRKRKEQKLEEIRRQEEARKQSKRVLMDPDRIEHPSSTSQNPNFILEKRRIPIANNHPKVHHDNTAADSFLF